MHGKGVYTWPDGKKYEGLYRKGQKHGPGTLSLPDGKVYYGNWRKGKLDGQVEC